jgi:membrane protein YdbS with pleckstrin-like domain
MPARPENRFYSKVDAWIVLLIGVALLLPCACMLFEAAQTGFTPAMFINISAILGLPLLLMMLIAIPCYYELRDEALTIRGGIMYFRQIPYEKIQGIRPTHDPLSAMAWSLDRLEILVQDGRRELISPANKERFIEELRAKLSSGSQAG